MRSFFIALKFGLFCLALFAGGISPVMAKPPAVHDAIGKTLKATQKRDKMGIFVLGSSTCSHCRNLKRYIEGGEVSVTADSFVMANLDSDDPKAVSSFFKQFQLDSQTEWKIPYVVITDAQGKVLVTWNGGRKAPRVEAYVQEALGKAGKKS